MANEQSKKEISEIEGKVARLATSEGAAGDVRHRWANRQVEMGGST